MTPDEHWDLWRRDPDATVFQSPAWIGAWWTHLGGGERVDVAVRDDAGRLVAALPATVWHDGGTRRLVPVAAGHSDYADILLDRHAGDVGALWAALAATRAHWDEVLLPDLRESSPMLAPPPDGWLIEDEPGEVCPVLAIPADGNVLGALTKSQRRKIVHDRHRAERLGGVETGLARPDEIDEALDALFALHAGRWARAGEAGVLANPRVQAFHRAAAPALAEAGLLRLAVVRHHARIVAVLLGFNDGRRGCSYINGVDMTVPGQSFGTLAFACLIDEAARSGCRSFHFLRGEEPYKYGWGAAATRTRRRTARLR